jgi:protein-disulfide isomerase/uncharacterized membrane protein
MKQKSIYQESSINMTIVMFILSAIMITLSVYLTDHYFKVKFPTGIDAGSLCNISSIFNCDKTTHSAASNIAGVPISVFGIIIGFLVMIGIFIKNLNFEKTVYFLLILNFVGCVALFFYSLIALGSLCPFCTLYYIISGITLFMFFKKSETYIPHPVSLVVIAVIFTGVALLTKMNVDGKLKDQSSVATSLIQQYYALPNLGEPKPASEFKVASAVNAPIKMHIFSDFECPACKALSSVMPQILARYGGKIDIQYYYYPLDNSCNPNMDRPLHQYACKAAYVATCMPTANFGIVHDDIFHNQDRLGAYLDEVIKNNKLESCVADAKTKEKVSSLINAATPFNISSTPTFLLNGVKIEGVLPPDQMFAIMDEIVKRAQ